MADKFHIGPCFFINIVLERKNRSYFCNQLCHFRRTPFVPCPRRRRYIRNNGNPLVFCKFCKLHVKTRVINRNQAVRPAFIHYSAKITAQLEKRRQFFYNFYKTHYAMFFYIKQNLAAGFTQAVAAHAEHFAGRVYFFQCLCYGSSVHIAGSLTGRNKYLGHNGSFLLSVLLYCIPIHYIL